ncbi:DNA ligase D, partial [Zeaxanthinibacter enoshimensis]|uniref:DNA ligase D n=1 Tax=Zeaxanthinibacter enoshimensis TaxID=392009 RepID=UPI00356AA70A
DELESLPHDCILDGEVVVLEKDGTPNFQKLQNYSAKTQGTLRYYVFDILYLNGHNTTELPLLDRKSLLPELLEDLENVVYSDHVKGMGTALYNKAIKAGLEGVMAKEAKSTYSPGFRTEKWLKVKESSTEDALICGYSDSLKGGGKFGSLILGMYQEGSLVYVGNCGTGFSNNEQNRLLNKLKTLEQEDSPFGKKINLKGRRPHWTKPVLVCEVKFSEWTSSGLMRHPVYMGLREDKDAEEVQGTTPVNNTKARESGTLEIDGLPVPVSNLEKVYWPGEGYTKYDLIDYYIQVSETILPYLKDRPQNLHRHPDGIDKPSFYQKDNEHLPSWVRTFPVYSESSKKEIDYLLCQDEATLVYMANLGCIELNPWNSTIEKPEHPTYTVIDIDPSSGNSFEEVIEVARVAKEVLDTAGIPGYCKTSGSSGLHIYIPLEQKYSYEEARDFTKLLCYYIHDKLPKLTSLERAVKKRKNKIYLDYLQNRKSQTLAAPYCVRPRAGAPVSMPLDWKEVKSGLEILDFTIENTAGRIKKKGDLFKAVLGKGIDMEKAIDHLSG